MRLNRREWFGGGLVSAVAAALGFTTHDPALAAEPTSPSTEATQTKWPYLLNVTLPTHGSRGRVVLNGQDISACVRRIEIVGDVHDITTAKIEYIGEVQVGADGRVEFDRSYAYVECEACRQQLEAKKPPLMIVQTTGMGNRVKTYAVPTTAVKS